MLLADRCAEVRARYRETVDPTTYILLIGVEATIRALMDEVELVTKRSTEAICGAVPLKGLLGDPH